MKKLTLGTVFLGIIFVSLVTMGFRKVFVADHKYPAGFTQTEWNAFFTHIQHGLVIMRTSSSPGAEVAAVQDSITFYASRIQQQVYQEIQADTLVKPKK